MEWPDRLDTEMPAPRSGEPASLRQDIIDELHDHLKCSLRRELLRDADHEHAIERVRESFGDPVQLARRLWYEALKEQVMRQRLIVVAAMGVLMAGIGTCVGAVALVRHNQASTIALQALVAENVAALERMAAAQSVTPPVSISTPGKLTLQFVNGDALSTPVEGVSVACQGDAYREKELMSLSENSDAKGFVRLGWLRPGEYRLRTTANGYESDTSVVVVRPGDETTMRIVCPPKPRPATLALDVAWPADLPPLPWGAVLRLRALSVSPDSETQWTVGDHLVLVSRSGQLYQLEGSGTMRAAYSAAGGVTDPRAFPLEPLQGKPVLKLPAGRYMLSNTYLVSFDEIDAERRTLMRVLNHMIDPRRKVQLKPSLSERAEITVPAGASRLSIPIELTEYDQQHIYAVATTNDVLSSETMFRFDNSRPLVEMFLLEDTDRSRVLDQHELERYISRLSTRLKPDTTYPAEWTELMKVVIAARDTSAGLTLESTVAAAEPLRQINREVFQHIIDIETH